ncbi:exodeoxyribonuclease VII small subunit [Peptoniphilus sp. KCTC 25270]|uniref:exodeoxyribonuclease VII small subunit n=1 Tax=Peptoniphilus sp. KCTC 25270 TaxID=2897414 RepID=UPI001E63F53E|nr:exodeoxyribonuclease VII small subunit [Peptoniphilus sp. KCTC 25270]MCD1147147.1 exodeoxyribonuclease VII small subunit [Peptoniphilus sp. KCTC 25270]
MKYKEGQEKLQKIVEEMNGGELSIEEMVEKYEEGMKIYKELSQMLTDFEQRVEVFAQREENSDEVVTYEKQ